MIWLGKSPRQYEVGEYIEIGPFQYTLSLAPSSDKMRYALFNPVGNNGLIFHYLGINPLDADDYLKERGFKDIHLIGTSTISAGKQEIMAIIDFLKQECQKKQLPF